MHHDGPLTVCVLPFVSLAPGSGEVWSMAGLWSGCCLCVSVNIRGAAIIILSKGVQSQHYLYGKVT